MTLIGFCDSDWAGARDDMKSTTGFIFSLGFGVFSWQSKKQETVAQSSAEAEYVSVAMATSQAIWLRVILEDVCEKKEKATRMFCDNKSAIAMAKDPVYNSLTRHIAVSHHFIREKIQEIELVYYKFEDQVTDIFTKALPKEKFQRFRELLGIKEQHIKGEC